MNEREIFDAALAITDPTERSGFLDRSCAGDSALREHLRGLIEAHDKLGGFLQRPMVAGDATVAPAHILSVGAVISGRYKLLEQIGEGGMGAVWIAEQTEPIKRRVALKLIKPGMDSRQVLSRFEAERQALALMDHPNIARVFDGGVTEEGRPYFVMEYVKGVPVTEYCDRARLSIHERLDLFVSVCQAVQHAHQKGIIHRDLKPSNILVCLYDGQPVPKVIDFGLAKAMHQSLTERTVYTAHGLMVGTPLYMSPEQAEFNNLDVDTRTDVYSLGVLLYELLTGSTPLEQRQFKDAAFGEILRLIKEEEPTKPSLKLSGSASLPSIAAQRGVEPGQLSRAVQGDLDWIVMKSLEKERSRRYETANGLARDIERYLADEAVEACPPSLRYRLSKVLRRNRGPAVAAALVFLALAAGVVGTSIGMVRASNEQRRALTAEAAAKEEARNAEKAAQAEADARRRANEEAGAAKAVRDFLQDDLLRQASILHQAEASSVTDDGSQFLRNPTINELLDRAAAELSLEKIDAKFPDLPFVQAEVLKAVGDAYAGVAPEKAIRHLDRAIEQYRSSRGPEDPATIAAQHSLGVALFAGRKDDEARRVLEAVRDLRSRVLGPYHSDTFATRDFLGRTQLGLKEPATIAYFQQLQDDARVHLGEEHVQTLKARFHLGIALMQVGRLGDAIREMEAVRDAAERLNFRSDHPYTITANMELGMAYKDAGRHREAAEAFEKCMELIQKSGWEARSAWTARHQLGWAYLAAGRQDDAIKAFQENLAIATSQGAQDVMTMEALGWALRNVDLDRSIAMYTQARQLRVDRNGPNDAEALRVGRSQAMMMRGVGKTEQALSLLDEVIPRMERVHGPQHLDLLKARLERAQCLSVLQQFDVADAIFEEVVLGMETLRGPTVRETLDARHGWLLSAERARRTDRATVLAAELVAKRRSIERPNSKLLANALFAQGRNLVIAGRSPEAEPALQESLAIFMRVCPELWVTSNCKQWLGMAFQDQQKLADAERHLLAAFSEFTDRREQTPPWGQVSRRDVAVRLIALYGSQGKAEEVAKWQKELEALRGSADAQD